MKKLYLEMVQIAENSQAPLFTGFKDDLYRHDKDAVEHDFLPGDVYYWSVKACGTNLALADKNSEYVQQLMSPKYAPERRHFLISIMSETEFSITEYTVGTIAQAVNKVRLNPKRVAPRQFGFDVITGIEPMFNGSVLLSDFTMVKDAVLYLAVNNNSASYITSTGKARTVGLPFSMDRKTGVYKITITSEFGHAVCEPIKMGVFTRAQKRLSAKKAA
jgi:hypothetical protein